MSFEKNFLRLSIKRFSEYKLLAEKALEQLEEKDLHFMPEPDSNSIAIIIHHLHGNMVSRWTHFLTEDGEKPWRKRDEEFESRNFSSAQLFDLWEKGWKTLLQTMESLTPEDLDKKIKIRTQELEVTDAIIRQLAHYSYHVGQIVYLARLIRGGGWKSLSIPKGGSDDFNKDMEQSRH